MTETTTSYDCCFHSVFYKVVGNKMHVFDESRRFVCTHTLSECRGRTIQLEEHKQVIGMLIIDKKKLKIADSGLPDMVVSQVPWYGKFQKLPIVKAKVGPKIMSLICDDKIFDDIPVKREVKATVSGIYIMEVRGVRGKLPKEAPKKKGFKGMIERLQEKAGAKPLK